MVSYIDTHAHLYAEEFDADRLAMLERAKIAGVNLILLPNIDAESLRPMQELFHSDPKFLRMMMGLHPCSVEPGYEGFLEVINSELSTGKYVAVGEIGMDLYWDKSTKDIQEHAFIRQCEMALHYQLPIAVHSRESTDELIAILQKMHHIPKGVFHCFSGTVEQARILIEMGYYLGIGGVVTFKNAGLKEVIREIGFTRIILETDSPYLAPVPHRGKRNESSYIPLIASAIAEACEISIEEVARITSHNASSLFRL